MSLRTLLQIVACTAAVSNAWALSGSQCVQPEEYESINFQLQSPSDDGAWVPPAEYSLLSFSLSHMEQREVFALGGQFRVERDGNAITPVFICEPGVPAVYHVGHYTVKCPEWAGQLIRIFSDETTLGDSGKIGVGRWEDKCIRWRTREYSCHDRVKPPPPPPPPGPRSVFYQNVPLWQPSAGPDGARICHTQLFSYWSDD